MIIKYQSYWASAKRLQPERATLTRLDIVNKTKFKQDFLDKKINCQDVARHNYEKGLLYEFSIFETESDSFPSVYITINHKNKHVGVNFIDPGGRNYLKYIFTEVKPKEELFLSEIWYYDFDKEDNDKANYRIHFVFNNKGNASARKYDDKNQKFSDFESKEPMDTSLLYEPYPEFGKYEGIIRLERDIPILKDNVRTYVYKDGNRYYKDKDGNLIEDN
ncbi:hypothetical protein SAMN04489722_101408 [Algibacter lectus]|uniref:hypothetical protein n=1 Tax=Algibacter lectus TaxID=221126 RepID=UPI0008E1D492|nr:hypothetical protein [Algibacter lectus]SFB98899.1 hypothetical protein SAMN04489722_101408 [Algibacter lectus]